jgi:hypothetical protein
MIQFRPHQGCPPILSATYRSMMTPPRSETTCFLINLGCYPILSATKMRTPPIKAGPWADQTAAQANAASFDGLEGQALPTASVTSLTALAAALIPSLVVNGVNAQVIDLANSPQARVPDFFKAGPWAGQPLANLPQARAPDFFEAGPWAGQPLAN